MAAIQELESIEWLSPMQDAISGVDCFVSVGTGQHSFNQAESSSIVPEGLKSAQDAIRRCVQISMNCHYVHQEVERLFSRAQIADRYYRLDVDRGLESVKMNESDGDTLQHISAVTKAYLQRHRDAVAQCARLISPKSRDVPSKLNPWTALICSSLPEATASFYGRGDELAELREALDPAGPGRKSVLLCGMGGSGKTQLALRHIQEEESRYSAIIWIQASTETDATYSISEALSTIASDWPRDLPLTQSRAGTPDTLQLTSRLRSTRYQNWLLVVDSADDPNDFLHEYIPDCRHGSVLVTSTRHRACKAFKPTRVPVEGLDLESARALLASVSGRNGGEDEGM